MSYKFRIKNLCQAGKKVDVFEDILLASLERYKYHQFRVNRFFLLSFYNSGLLQFTNRVEKSLNWNRILVVGWQGSDTLSLYMYIHDQYHFYPVGSYCNAMSGYEDMWLSFMYKFVLPIDNRIEKMDLLEIFRTINDRRAKLKQIRISTEEDCLWL